MENTVDTKRRPKTVFLTTLLIGIIPLIFINFVIKDDSAGIFAKRISVFLYDHLLGNIGMTSSHFPISSNISAYYNAFFAPLLCVMMFIVKGNNFTLDDFKKGYDFSLANYFRIITLFTVPYVFILLLMCFFNADLTNALAKISVFGRNKSLFTLFYTFLIFPLWFYLNYLALMIYFVFTKIFFLRRCELKGLTLSQLFRD